MRLNDIDFKRGKEMVLKRSGEEIGMSSSDMTASGQVEIVDKVSSVTGKRVVLQPLHVD